MSDQTNTNEIRNDESNNICQCTNRSSTYENDIFPVLTENCPYTSFTCCSDCHRPINKEELDKMNACP